MLLALLLPLIVPSVAPRLPRLDLLCLRLELHRFPDQEQCRKQMDRAAWHLDYIDKHILLFAYDRADWQAYRGQVCLWRDLWNDLHTCRTPPLITEDVGRLRRIQTALGPEDYAAGSLPPPVAPYLHE